MLEDDVDDVVAVQVSDAPHEYLLAIIVVPGVVDEISVIGRPSRECAGGVLDVGFAVMSRADGEELHEFPSPVLIGVPLAVPGVVQIAHHRG